MMSSIFSRIVFYPTLSFNYLMTKIMSRQWYTRIDDTVVLGALPVKWISNKLVEGENIGGVISLNEDFELNYIVYSPQEWGKLGVEQLRIPTVDFIGAPSQSDLRKGVEFIQKHRSLQKSVYIHCKAGRTRSTTVVACYLMVQKKLSPDEAVSFIKEKRPHIVLLQPHTAALQSFYEYLCEQ